MARYINSKNLFRIRHRVGKKTLQTVTEKLNQIDFITD